MSIFAAPNSAPPPILLGLEPTRALLHLLHAKMAGWLPAVAQELDQYDGKGRPVVVAPGLGCNHLGTHVLRMELAARNWCVEDWGGGFNVGPRANDLTGWVAPMRERVEQLHAQTGHKVALVGWSLGGIAARELSRVPGVPVSRVVTLGSPFSDLGATNATGAYRLLNGATFLLTEEAIQALAKEPPVPGAALYSLSDGVVNGEACRQRNPRRTRNVEVSGASHFGMVLCPRVLRVVMQELMR